MRRPCPAALVLLLALGAGARDLRAQQAIPATPIAGAAVARADSTAGCTYMTCAIRLEPSFWNGARLVRGTDGTTVARVNALWPDDMSSLLGVSDSAAAYGRAYSRDGRIASALSLVGAGVLGAALSERDPSYGLAAVGLGTIVVAIPFELTSARSFSRAIWWYNASVTPKPER